MKKPVLNVKNISVHYGSIQAIRDISLEIFPGELVSLIGSNGAGKTTLLKSILGLLPIDKGKVLYNDRDITNTSTHIHSAQGLTLAPEGRGIFMRMNILENMQMGAYYRNDSNNIKHDLEYIFQLFPILSNRKNQTAGTLSGGEQQMLAIARALMSKPKLLLLDEPSMGLAPLLVKTIFEIIKKINQDGVSVLLIEQNAHAALSLAHRAYVMEHGEIVLEGEASDLIHNTRIKTAYLGA